ncbi:MAG TPA: exodeoxyribonuclease VII small subunit [Chloroflexota bacterium]
MSPKSEGSVESSRAEPRSFEAAFGELQQVVQQLEDGGLDLERAVRLSERGGRLAQVCERFIDQAELRVTRLRPESASALSDAAATDT